MGYGFSARCNQCGTEFIANLGGGIVAASFHCEQCGVEELIDLNWTEDKLPDPCSCGGTFSRNAGPRCPKCRSADWEEVIDPDHPAINWD